MIVMSQSMLHQSGRVRYVKHHRSVIRVQQCLLCLSHSPATSLIKSSTLTCLYLVLWPNAFLKYLINQYPWFLFYHHRFIHLNELLWQLNFLIDYLRWITLILCTLYFTNLQYFLLRSYRHKECTLFFSWKYEGGFSRGLKERSFVFILNTHHKKAAQLRHNNRCHCCSWTNLRVSAVSTSLRDWVKQGNLLLFVSS